MNETETVDNEWMGGTECSWMVIQVSCLQGHAGVDEPGRKCNNNNTVLLLYHYAYIMFARCGQNAEVGKNIYFRRCVNVRKNPNKFV